jgi:hypothetical protein
MLHVLGGHPLQCVEVKEQIDQRIWDKRRIINETASGINISHGKTQ